MSDPLETVTMAGVTEHKRFVVVSVFPPGVMSDADAAVTITGYRPARNSHVETGSPPLKLTN